MDKKTAEPAVYSVLIQAPIERVWAELINTTSPRPFFWNSRWDTPAMAAGEPYRMVSNQDRTVAVVGQILELDPPHRLVTSFALTSLDDPLSKVTYTLKETAGGTELCLITEDVLAGSASARSMADGSRFIVRNFKAYMETGKVTLGARLQLALFSLMAPLTPKRMAAERWPLGTWPKSG